MKSYPLIYWTTQWPYFDLVEVWRTARLREDWLSSWVRICNTFSGMTVTRKWSRGAVCYDLKWYELYVRRRERIWGWMRWLTWNSMRPPCSMWLWGWGILMWVWGCRWWRSWWSVNYSSLIWICVTCTSYFMMVYGTHQWMSGSNVRCLWWLRCTRSRIKLRGS